MVGAAGAACLTGSAAGQSDTTASARAGTDGSPPLEVLWRAGIGRGATALPVFAEGRLYVAAARKQVKAFDAGGRELWSRELARGFQASPRLAGGVLLVVAPHPDARAYGLDPETGETLWEREVGDVVQDPLPEPGRAIFVSLGGWVRALDPRSGDLLWETRLEGVFPGGALLTGGDLVVLSAAGVLYRISAATGAPLGSRDLKTRAAPTLLPLPGGDGFLTASFDGRVRGFGFDLAPLTIDFPTAPLLHPPALAGDRLFVPGNDRVLRGFSLSSGERLWERLLPVGVAGPPTPSPDGARVAVGDLAGSVLTLAASDGRLLSHTPTAGEAARPAWAGDRLAVITEGGSLLVLEAQPAPQ